MNDRIADKKQWYRRSLCMADPAIGWIELPDMPLRREA